MSLVETDDWRARSFRVCGNAEALRRAVQLAQVVAVRRHRAAPTDASRKRVARFAQWSWGEELRLYYEQRNQLARTHEHGAWADVADLSAMGPRARDRAMLAVLALWGQRGRLRTPPAIPEGDRARIEAWLAEADETAVSRLYRDLLAVSRD